MFHQATNLRRLTPLPLSCWPVRTSRYSEKYIARLARSILRFVSQCHAKGIIYRDIKVRVQGGVGSSTMCGHVCVEERVEGKGGGSGLHVVTFQPSPMIPAATSSLTLPPPPSCAARQLPVCIQR